MWSFYSRLNMYGFSITLFPLLLVSKMYSRIIDFSKKEQHNPAPAMLEWSCHISQCLLLSLVFGCLQSSSCVIAVVCSWRDLSLALSCWVFMLAYSSSLLNLRRSVFSRFHLRLVWEGTFLLRLCMLSFQFYLLKGEQLLYTQCLEQEFQDWTSQKLFFL